MAYKPKYAQSKKKKQPELTPAPAPKPAKKQRGKVGKIIALILGIVLIPASIAATGKLMGGMLQNLGRPKAATVNKTQNMTILADFDAAVSASLENAQKVVAGSDKPEIQEEEVPPVRKVYWIDDDVQVAPEPDQSKFGETTNPDKLREVLTEAKWLLDGQSTYFQPEQQLYEGSTVKYYLDDSLLAITWQEVHDGSVYTFSEVKVSHPSQFRRHLADGVGHGPQAARHPELLCRQHPAQANGGEDGKGASGGGVEDGAEVTAEHRPQKDPGKEHLRPRGRPHGEHREHGHNIGKPQLDPGNRHQRRDLGLHQKNRQGNGGQQPQPGYLLHVHPHYLLCVDFVGFPRHKYEKQGGCPPADNHCQLSILL